MGNTSSGKLTPDSKTNKSIKEFAAKAGLSDEDAMLVLVNAGADAVLKQTGARALASGGNIAVGAGSDAKSKGNKLISHELAHTVQHRPLEKTVGDMERAAQKAAFFIRKNNASSDATNR